MVTTSLLSAFVAGSLFSMASAQQGGSPIVSIPTPTASVALNAMSKVGCFSTGVPLDSHGSYTFQTAGNCQPICVGLKKPVMGLVNGEECWCGDLLPPEDTKVDDTSCNTPCVGFDKEFCGGNKKWMISLTGLNKNQIEHFDPKSVSSSAAPSAVPSKAPANTVVVTASDAPTNAPAKDDSGPNKAGIAAGVVVGVIGLAAIIGGVFFFLRNKRRRQVEEEYRRQAAVSDFASGNKLHTSNSSMADSRLDPEFMARRASNGSIADNEDYSRRILKVTNPDGH